MSVKVASQQRVPDGCLSVVVPCYNEERTIVQVLTSVLEQPCVGEVVVVDDGSRDRSVALVASMNEPRIRLLSQPRNMGKGAALRRGLALASRPYVVIQDADLEYDPAEYPELLAPLVANKADVVYGSRFHTSYARRVLYFWHSLGNTVLTLASNMATDLNLTDMETCYKAFRREVLQGLTIEEDRFGFEPEITAKVAGKGWRIFEVGISYSGRTYAEGKKIGWKDGVRAMYCIARYGITTRLAPASPEVSSFAAADATLQPTLKSLDGAANYARWIADLLAPHLGPEILEIGAGHGTMTAQLLEHGKVVATEPSSQCQEALRTRFAGDPRVEVVASDAELGERRFDAVVLVNVLEHIEDDVGTLEALSRRLKPGGALLVYSPALPALMSRSDRAMGHYRRYERPGLMTTAYRAGLDVVSMSYVNSVGAAAWWLVAKQLGAEPTQGAPVRLYDSLVVPWLRRLEARVPPPIGQSLFMVARRAEQPVPVAAPEQRPHVVKIAP